MIPLTLSVLILAAPVARAKEYKADVVVYGATAAGVIAARAAAKEGKSVILVEPGTRIGGMVSGGLGATDTGKRAAIGGYSRDFFNRVKTHYEYVYGPGSAPLKDCDDGFKFEPKVAKRVFESLIAEAKVEVVFGQRVELVLSTGPRIDAFATQNFDTFKAAVFIDASYEGDLMARAKVGYTVGREPAKLYGESLGGVQARSAAHQFGVAVPALAANSKPLPLVRSGTYPAAGSGDRAVQAYNFRLCLTDRPDNRLPWAKPKDYDSKQYELLARYLEARPAVTFKQLCNPVRIPNGKTDTNNNGPISTDHIGANWEYPEADYAARDAIREDHVRYTQGFFHFLATDARTPKPLREEVNSWGLAADEFDAPDHWPHQLYVREARRMIGAFVMTQKDITDDRAKADSVGLGSYNTDSHHVQRLVDKDGNAINEGDFQVAVKPYAIPYRSLTPKPAECTNLLVPVCVSASHVAYGTVRMEPVYMILGHACGVAAALAIDGKTAVQEVGYDKLKAKLLAQKSVLDPAAVPEPPAPGRLAVESLPGILVDDSAARTTGEWKSSASIPRFVGTGYLHDDHADKGKKSVRFVPDLPAAGRYEVFLYYTPAGNRATNVPVVVNGKDGEKKVTVDQKKSPGAGGCLSLGTFSFAVGRVGWVEVQTTGTDGHVVADAVRFVPVK